jgi:hypothetical protein
MTDANQELLALAIFGFTCLLISGRRQWNVLIVFAGAGGSFRP